MRKKKGVLVGDVGVPVAGIGEEAVKGNGFWRDRVK